MAWMLLLLLPPPGKADAQIRGEKNSCSWKEGSKERGLVGWSWAAMTVEEKAIDE
jgi:hypothetical protein